MLLSIALFTGIFCAGCGARSDEILLESQEDTSDTVEETEQPVGIDGLGAALGFCSLRCRVAFYRAAERFCVMAGGE